MGIKDVAKYIRRFGLVWLLYLKFNKELGFIMATKGNRAGQCLIYKASVFTSALPLFRQPTLGSQGGAIATPLGAETRTLEPRGG